MLKVIKALLLFALMLAIPIAADNLLHSRPDVPLKKLPSVEGLGGIQEGAAFLFLALLAAGVAIYYYSRKYDRLDYIQSCLKRAERDLNSLLNSGMEHGGRKNRAVERSEWNRMTVSDPKQH